MTGHWTVADILARGGKLGTPTERQTEMTAWPDVPTRTVTRPTHAPIPHVVAEVAALRNLPHMTILRVQTGAAAQVINDDDGHYLSYAGTDEVDYLDPETLDWDRKTMHTLSNMLPAVILDQPA